MPEEIKNNSNPPYLWIVLIGVVLIIGGILIYTKYQKASNISPAGTGITKTKEKNAEIKKFASEQEFKDYLEKSKNISGSYLGRGAGGAGWIESNALSGTADKSFPSGQAGLPAAPLSTSAPSRISETNVQVAGIDEPDVAKTDGKEIYFSVPNHEVMPLMPSSGWLEPNTSRSSLSSTGGTNAIKAFPPENLGVDSKIDKTGDLLLVGKILVVIPTERYFWNKNNDKIFGYDVTDPAKPKEVWNIELKESTSIVGARLTNGKVYLATKTDFGEDDSCLLKPMAVNGKEFSIKCTDIYHPAAIIPSEATYTAMVVDPQKGEVEKSISFVGSNDFTASQVYMSGDFLYLAYYNPGDSVKMLHSFFSENKDLAPDWLVQKLKNLSDYDISNSAKMTEIWELLTRYQSSLSSDDRMRLQNEMNNRIGDYLAHHRRELDSTGIVKIKTDDLSINSTGSVPGKLLNQFSIDEYNGDLRVASTVGESFLSWGLGFGGRPSDTSANDVYILGDNLKTQGSVIDLGKGERIYAVRFLEDKGYVVTFKQTDPFYVLDLSDAMNPKETGELKIPGYSSYLHPVAKNKILGIGEENNQVKVSLFDVSDPADPKEASKYNLNEYWSEAATNHHAFLQDSKHQIFFLPGTKGGYIFSYSGDELKLQKAIADIQAKRAIYLDNFLYVIGENKLTVFDENNWESINELDL